MGIEVAERIDVGQVFTLEPKGYPGVIVTALPPMSLRELFALKKIADNVSLSTDEEMAALDAGLKRFGDEFLDSWNVNLRGKEVEANGDGLLSLPTRLQFEILKSWLIAAQGGIEAPLAQPSSNGPDSPTPPTIEPDNE